MVIARRLTLVLLALAGCATTWDAKWSEPATSPTAASPEQLQAAIAEGDALWKERGDKAKLIAAIAKWESAAAQGDAELLTKLARAHYLLGDGFYFLEGNHEARYAEYEKGLAWATRALKLAAPAFVKAMAEGKSHIDSITLAPKEAVPAMYWYATTLGRWAASKGVTTRLRYKDDIKATMDHVKSLDETYFHAAPLRYFGSFEATTAGIAGGSLKKSEEYYKRALELSPAYLGTKVLWADVLCTRKSDRPAYKKLLEEVVAADAAADPDLEPENKLEQLKARQLLAQIDDRF